MALAIPIAAGRVLVGRRSEGTHLQGLWEFPGGKVEPGENPASAARRELAEETGLVAEQLEPLTVVVHDYAECSVRLHAFVVRWPGAQAPVGPAGGWIWIEPAQLESLAMPSANAAIVRALRRQL